MQIPGRRLHVNTVGPGSISWFGLSSRPTGRAGQKHNISCFYIPVCNCGIYHVTFTVLSDIFLGYFYLTMTIAFLCDACIPGEERVECGVGTGEG